MRRVCQCTLGGIVYHWPVEEHASSGGAGASVETMKDLPCIVMAATVWAYWACVGAMIVRVRRRTRKLSGIVPSQRLEQLMWIVWVPLVAAWMVLPYVAAGSNPCAVATAGLRARDADQRAALGRRGRGPGLPGPEHPLLAAHGPQLAHGRRPRPADRAGDHRPVRPGAAPDLCPEHPADDVHAGGRADPAGGADGRASTSA